MTLKIPITQESEGEKRHFHSYRLLLFLMNKKLTALSDLIINILKLCNIPDWYIEVYPTLNGGYLEVNLPACRKFETRTVGSLLFHLIVHAPV